MLGNRLRTLPQTHGHFTFHEVRRPTQLPAALAPGRESAGKVSLENTSMEKAEAIMMFCVFLFAVFTRSDTPEVHGGHCCGDGVS